MLNDISNRAGAVPCDVPTEISPKDRPDLALPPGVLAYIGSYLTEAGAVIPKPLYVGREVALEYVFNEIERYHHDHPSLLGIDFAVDAENKPAMLREVFHTLWKKTNTTSPMTFPAYLRQLALEEVRIKDTCVVWSMIAKKIWLAPTTADEARRVLLTVDELITVLKRDPTVFSRWIEDNQEVLRCISHLDLSNLNLKYLPKELFQLTWLKMLNLRINQLTFLPPQ